MCLSAVCLCGASDVMKEGRKLIGDVVGTLLRRAHPASIGAISLVLGRQWSFGLSSVEAPSSRITQ
jgi:hypothetical protein